MRFFSALFAVVLYRRSRPPAQPIRLNRIRSVFISVTSSGSERHTFHAAASAHAASMAAIRTVAYPVCWTWFLHGQPTTATFWFTASERAHCHGRNHVSSRCCCGCKQFLTCAWEHAHGGLAGARAKTSSCRAQGCKPSKVRTCVESMSRPFVSMVDWRVNSYTAALDP